MTADAEIDYEREARTGFPEIVYGATKTAEQIEAILSSMTERTGFAIASRVAPEVGTLVSSHVQRCVYDSASSCLKVGQRPETGRKAAIVCAGTSDLPVAAEAAFVLRALGHSIAQFNDVGVAGIHRILSKADRIETCDVIIVVAGMEGALPSVVAGMTRKPIVAIPTSIGYGVSAGGFVALLSMLSSCAPGIGVVNINNGVGAAALAHKIMRVGVNT